MIRLAAAFDHHISSQEQRGQEHRKNDFLVGKTTHAFPFHPDQRLYPWPSAASAHGHAMPFFVEMEQQSASYQTSAATPVPLSNSTYAINQVNATVVAKVVNVRLLVAAVAGEDTVLANASFLAAPAAVLFLRTLDEYFQSECKEGDFKGKMLTASAMEARARVRRLVKSFIMEKNCWRRMGTWKSQEAAKGSATSIYLIIEAERFS